MQCDALIGLGCDRSVKVLSINSFIFVVFYLLFYFLS